MELLEKWGDWLLPKQGFQPQELWQLVIIAVLFLVCAYIFRPKGIVKDTDVYSLKIWFRKNRGFLFFTVSILAIYLFCSFIESHSFTIFRFFAILTPAWLFIGAMSALLKEKFWSDSVALFCYVTTSLFGLSLFNSGIDLLEKISFSIGSFRVSAGGILAGIVAFVMTLWVSMALARIIEVRVKSVPKLTPSLQVLISKMIRILFIFIACITAISSMGVNLSALTALGGAIGLGLGFGLQKVVSNFVSGIILLLDNSIKPGDVVEIDGTYGWINNLRARYASVITRDGTEHLIPNEDLITQKVINWSFTDNLIRSKVPIGVSYGSDPHLCIKLVIEAALKVDRVLKNPSPICLLRGFGDSSVDLELRFWILDPSNGLANVQSKILLNVWDIFKENGIEIPFPQRDLHIRSSEIIPVHRSNPDPE
jgi:small-conductance mechanosensitive channel